MPPVIPTDVKSLEPINNLPPSASKGQKPKESTGTSGRTSGNVQRPEPRAELEPRREPEQQQPAKRAPIGVIIDGIGKIPSLSAVRRELKRLMPTVIWKTVEILDKGGIYLLATAEFRQQVDKFFFESRQNDIFSAAEFCREKPDGSRHPANTLRIHRPGEAGRMLKRDDSGVVIVKGVQRSYLEDEIKELVTAEYGQIVEVAWLTPPVDDSGKRNKNGLVRLKFGDKTTADQLITAQKIVIDSQAYRCTTSMPLPNPLQCLKCGVFGHVASRCEKEQEKWCGHCLAADHDRKTCMALMKKCGNCGQNHSTFSKVCPVFKKAREELITKLNAKSKRYVEAPAPAQPAWNAAGNRELLITAIARILIKAKDIASVSNETIAELLDQELDNSDFPRLSK
jgi:hypothetical protein